MAAFFLIGIACFFFIVGHSTLLHFKSEDLSSMSIAEVILPWPKKGKFVSVLCLGLSGASLILLLLGNSDADRPVSISAWKVLIIFAVLPSFIYGSFLFRRVRKTPQGILYFPSPVSEKEWALPLMISAAVSALSYFFE